MNGSRGFFRPRLAFASRWRRERQDAQGGGERAERFRMLILPHMDAAYTLARYLARDPTRAEDIVQDAFLRAFRGFDGFRGEHPKAWLLAIVRNCYLSSVGAGGRAVHVPIDGGLDPVGTGGEAEQLIDGDDPEAILARQGEIAMLRATVEGLPEPFRETIVLRELEELSYKEIALLTQVPIGTVMSRLARARQMLAAILLPDAPGGRKAGQ